MKNRENKKKHICCFCVFFCFSKTFDKIFKSIWNLIYFRLFILFLPTLSITDQGSNNVIAWCNLCSLCTEAFGRSIFSNLWLNSRAVGTLKLCNEIHFGRSGIGQVMDVTQYNILRVFFFERWAQTSKTVALIDVMVCNNEGREFKETTIQRFAFLFSFFILLWSSDVISNSAAESAYSLHAIIDSCNRRKRISFDVDNFFYNFRKFYISWPLLASNHRQID